MAAHNDLGHWGEEKAADYLMTRGYRILHRDWRYGHRDIDIVAMKDNVIAIVEVKTRRNNVFMEPELAVDRRKVRSLMIAANAYVKAFRIDNELRFDIISVTGTGNDDCEINHIESAFMPLPY
jgi:putative endonuclease